MTYYRDDTAREAAEKLHEETADDGRVHVDGHDLGRTWGTALLEEGALPSVVMA